jgi:hypothetical protein
VWLESAEQKVHETPSQPVSGVCWHKPVIPSYLGSTKSRTVVQANLGMKQDPVSKITNMKRARAVAHMVECEALSSTPSTTKSK